MAGVELPKQVVVPGAGLTAAGQPTQETVERTMTGVYYAQEHGAEKVIFSGGHGVLNAIQGGSTEADVMAELATDRGLDAGVISFDRESRNGFETFLNVGSLLEPEPTTVIAHAYYIPRLQFMAGLALPDMDITWYEAMGVHTGKAKAPLNERFMRLLTRGWMVGVKEGDTDALRTRSNSMLYVFNHLGVIKTTLTSTVLKQHTSVEGKAANLPPNDQDR